MKIRKNKLWSAGIVLLALGLIILIYTRQEKLLHRKAITVAQKYCEKFVAICDGQMTFEARVPIDTFFPYSREYDRALADNLNIFISKAPDLITQPYMNINVSRKDFEVQEYANSGLLQDYENKYKGKEGRGNDNKATIWPDFMPEKEAEKIAHSIFSRMTVPADFVFDKMQARKAVGVWNAYWIRQRDGIRFEGDRLAISIMGATGEFVGYTKAYRGTVCPLDVRVSKEQALKIARESLRAHVNRKLLPELSELYSSNAELLIINPPIRNILGYPLRLSGWKSKLAWVVNIEFTGGVKASIEKKELEEFNSEERNQLSQYFDEVHKRWREMDRPPRSIKLKIDAATGAILYDSQKLLNRFRWPG